MAAGQASPSIGGTGWQTQRPGTTSVLGKRRAQPGLEPGFLAGCFLAPSLSMAASRVEGPGAATPSFC